MKNYISGDKCKEMMVEMLADIDRFCTEHGLRYMLAFGTLLGAVRHKGFIPWDDDVDIWMPRPDYTYFVKNYKHDHYKVISADTDPDYPLDYPKLHDSRTLVEEKGGDGSWGIFIDIFILDGIPSIETGKRMFRRAHRLRRVAANQRFTYKMKFSRNLPLSKNIAILIGRISHPFISLRSVLKKIDKENGRYDYSKCKYCGDLADIERIFLTSDFEHLVRADFEGHEFLIPKEYDMVLHRLFGDYMQLPPEEERVSIHGLKAFWLQ